MKVNLIIATAASFLCLFSLSASALELDIQDLCKESEAFRKISAEQWRESRQELHESIIAAEINDLELAPYLNTFKRVEKPTSTDVSQDRATRIINNFDYKLDVIWKKHFKQKKNNKIQDDLNTYTKSIEKKIRDVWSPPNHRESLKTKVRFDVLKNGTVTDLQILKSSGHQGMDNLAKKAVLKAAPFLPWPRGNNVSRIHIDFTFEYSVLSSGAPPKRDLIDLIESIR